MPGTPKVGDFGLQRGGGLAMLLVRAGTLSRWGHACVAVGDVNGPGVQVVEALPNGVRARTSAVADWTWGNVTLTDDQRTNIAELAMDDVGKGYDWPGIAGFLLRWFKVKLWRRSKDHPDKMEFCSELVAWTYRESGVDLFPGVAPRDISPGDLAQYLVEH